MLACLQCGIPDYGCGARPRGRDSYGGDVSGVCAQAGRLPVLPVYVATDQLSINRGTNIRYLTSYSRITSPPSRSGRDLDSKSSDECPGLHGWRIAKTWWTH